MTCVEFQRKLSAYADGELSRWTRWKVQQHLGHCPDCAGLLQELDELDGAICRCVAADSAPGYLTDAVIRRLPAMPPPWRRPATVVRWATAGALAGAQLLAVYGAYWWGFAARGSSPAGTRGGMTAPVGALREAPRSGTAGSRSESFSSPGVWGRREGRFPLALPEPVTRSGRSKRKSDLQPVGAH
jgi:anti-sigma factor RsiW